MCQELGGLINVSKSELISQQQFMFVGIRYDLVCFRAFPYGEKLSSSASDDAAHPTRLSSSSTRVWQSAIGVVSSQSRLVTWGCFHVRPLQWNLALHWNAWREDPNISVLVLPAAQSAAPWWLELDHCVGVPVTSPTAPVRLFTDAGTVGWESSLAYYTSTF